MNRRYFFRSLAGAAVPLKKAEPQRILDAGTCACGGALIYHGNREEPRFVCCTSQQCRYFNRPFAPPTFPVEPANPAIVARIRAEEKRQAEAVERLRAERERERAKFVEPTYIDSHAMRFHRDAFALHWPRAEYTVRILG